MHNAVLDMIENYNCSSTEDYKNALKEVIQEIALLGLFRGKFFDKAAFYGGTALRIFYGLQRFSEDLDFSLIRPEGSYDITPQLEYIENELESYGFSVDVIKKEKSEKSAIESAFIKDNTLTHMVKIQTSELPEYIIHPDEIFKIKLEVDTDPPGEAEYEVKYHLKPIPFSVRLFTLESLFAGKVHAILCRKWKNRVKGRDFFDYVWYLSRGTALNLHHLEERMKQTGHLRVHEVLKKDNLYELLFSKFSSVNFKQAVSDVRPFVREQDSLNVWSSEFFTAITKEKLMIS
ncbi:MAG: nucleotidyl transferase AbiEii/AbiGii toxin family protein [Spirochaetota bacterium]